MFAGVSGKIDDKMFCDWTGHVYANITYIYHIIYILLHSLVADGRCPSRWIEMLISVCLDLSTTLLYKPDFNV